jgi:Ser/Thr protein kinase RdoA (MazF antagonist)
MIPISEKFIETHWPLTGVSFGETLQAFGPRLVRVIMSNEGPFIVKVSDQWHSAETATRHTFIFDYLQDNNFSHAPAILKTKSGRNFQAINDQYALVLPYLPGEAPAKDRETYRRLGEILGHLHALTDYPYPYLFSVADVLPEFFELAKRLPFGEEYIQLVKALPDFEDFPLSLIHGEMIGNAIQTPDDRIIILDWDEAGIGTRILDLGHPLIQVFLSEDLVFDQVGAPAFYQGYFSKGSLTGREREHIFDAALFYALRYVNVIYGDTGKRWQRIKFAVDNRAMLDSAIRG